jgi:hypothetical protein
MRIQLLLLIVWTVIVVSQKPITTKLQRKVVKEIILDSVKDLAQNIINDFINARDDSSDSKIKSSIWYYQGYYKIPPNETFYMICDKCEQPQYGVTSYDGKVTVDYLEYDSSFKFVSKDTICSCSSLASKCLSIATLSSNNYCQSKFIGKNVVFGINNLSLTKDVTVYVSTMNSKASRKSIDILFVFSIAFVIILML